MYLSFVILTIKQTFLINKDKQNIIIFLISKLKYLNALIQFFTISGTQLIFKMAFKVMVITMIPMEK